MIDFFSAQRGGCVCKTCGKRIDGLTDLGAIFIKDKNRIQTEAYCKQDTPQGGGGDIGNLVSISVLPTTGVYETGVTTHPGEMPSVAPEFRIHMVANFDSGMSIPLNFNNTADKAAIDKLVGTVLRVYGKPYDIIPTLPEVKYDTVGNFFYVDQEAHTKTETGTDVVYQERVELKFTDLINTPTQAQAKLLEDWVTVAGVFGDKAHFETINGSYPTTHVSFDSKSPVPSKILPIHFHLDTSAIEAQVLDPTYALKTYPDDHPLYPGQQYLEIYSHARLLYGGQVAITDFRNLVPVEYPLEADKVIDHVEFHATNVSLMENFGSKHDPDALYEVFVTIDGSYYIYYENMALPEVVPMNKPGQAAYTDPNNYEIIDFYINEIRHMRWTDASFTNDKLPTVVMDNPPPSSATQPNATLSGPSVFEMDLKVKASHYNDYDNTVIVDGVYITTNIPYNQDMFDVRVRMNADDRITYVVADSIEPSEDDRGDHIYICFNTANERFISDITGNDIPTSDTFEKHLELTNQGSSYDGGSIVLTDGTTVQVGNVATTKMLDFFASLMGIIDNATFYDDYDLPIGVGMTIPDDSISETSKDTENTSIKFTVYIPDPTYDSSRGDMNNKLYMKEFTIDRKKIDSVHDQLTFSMTKSGDHYDMVVTNKVEMFTENNKDLRVQTSAKTFDETVTHKVSTDTQPDGSTHSEPSLHTVLVGIVNAIQDTDQYTSALVARDVKGISVDPTMYGKKCTASGNEDYNWVTTTAELIVPDPSWSRSDTSHATANRNLLDKTNQQVKVLLPSRVVAKFVDVTNPANDTLTLSYDAKLDLSKNGDASWTDTRKTSQVTDAPIVLDDTEYPGFVNKIMGLIQNHYGWTIDQSSGQYAHILDENGNPITGIQVASAGMYDTANYELMDATVIVPNPAHDGSSAHSATMVNALEVPVKVWVPKGKAVEYVSFIEPVNMDTVEYHDLGSPSPLTRRMTSPDGFRYRITYTDGSTLDVTGRPNDPIFPMPALRKVTQVRYNGYTGNIEFHNGETVYGPDSYMTCTGEWIYDVYFEDGTSQEVRTDGSNPIWPLPPVTVPEITDVEFMGPSNGDWNSIQYENLTDDDPRNRKMYT